MNYIEWNNALGKYFFNEEKAEQEVHLFVTKQDIVKVGRQQDLDRNNEDIFFSYIEAIRKGIPGKSNSNNILGHALYAYDKWQEKPIKIDGVPVEYPLYIGYLCLFVLPLTESNQPDLRVDAYYPRIRSFLKKFDLPSMRAQNDNNNWNALWYDLHDWSFEKRNTELGYFEVHRFRNGRWVYVGIPLSQSIFPIQAIRQLPQFFETCGLVPGEEVDGTTFWNLLLANGERHLGLSRRVLNVIRDSDNEMGQSIIHIVKKNYQEWTGDTDQYDSDTNTIKKGNTIAQLRLCIEGDRARGYQTYFRLYTKLDFPEDLTFTFSDQKYECQQVGKSWSNPLLLPFSEGMELQDSLNKWKAKFPEKEVRLFIAGKNFHLSGWVEVPYMVTSRMLLLARKELSAHIEEWGDCFANGDFKKISKDITEDHFLYEICKPPIGHPDIPNLQFKSNKRINVHGGIKIGVRTWLKDLLPEVELENGRGDETVYIQYIENEGKITLTRKDCDQPIWNLPEDIKTRLEFYIKVKGYEAQGENLKNYINDFPGNAKMTSRNELPIRNEFGKVINSNEPLEYIIGSNIETHQENEYSNKQFPYTQFFRPQFNSGNFKIDGDKTYKENLLVKFLTFKGICNVKDYYEVYETTYFDRFTSEEINSHRLGLSELKRWSLNYLDYMGILDYEYSTKKIVVLPPQFILLPTSAGRKALLIGGRTKVVICKIRNEAEKRELNLKLMPQHSSLTEFNLPQTITIEGEDGGNGMRIERKMVEFAEACSIPLDLSKITPFRLNKFAGNIEEYKKQLSPDERFDDSGWTARVFDPKYLRYIQIMPEDIDKMFSLVEYKLNEYTYKHRLWQNEQSYDINKNWGRYIVVNNSEQSIIFHDRSKKIIAIPASLPLPRIISEALTLCSGKAPYNVLTEIQGMKTYFNIYENIPSTFASNYLKKVGQSIQELKINL